MHTRLVRVALLLALGAPSLALAAGGQAPAGTPPAGTPPAGAGSGAAAAKPGALGVVAQVQKVYEGTVDLHAHFSQVVQGMNGKRQASGEVWLKKPGKMRWDYSKPEKKLFVADGTLLWVYEPEDEQAFKQPLSSSQLPAQVSFLFGKGKLADDFDISALEGSGLGGAGDVVLKLVPKVATAQYRYLAFVVDPRSFLVKETVVYDQQSGQNRLIFSGIETNLKGGIADSRFHFSPPPGTNIINANR